MHWSVFGYPLIIVPVLMLTAGCGGDVDLESMVDKGVRQVRDTVDRGVNEVQRQTGQKGSLRLEMSPPVRTKECHGQVIVIDDRRPAVLQMTTYQTVEAETFPAVFLRATVEVSSADELVGKTVSCQAFVQPTSDGPVWHTRPDTLLQLQVDEFTENKLIGRILGGKIVSQGGEQSVTGAFAMNVR